LKGKARLVGGTDNRHGPRINGWDVFLDTSTILAACWSNWGLSRLLVEYAPKADWRLVTADDGISEVEKNVRKHPAGAVDWVRIVRARLESVGLVFVLDRPIVFKAPTPFAPWC